VRQLDERLGFGDLIQQHLTDPRRGKNTQFPVVDLLRQFVYSRSVGYEDVNDAERPGDRQPGGGSVLRQARDRRAVDQGRQAVKMTRLSCHRFHSNEVRLWLSVIAYNLGNLWRRLFGPMVRRIAAPPLLVG
jgi:hypothetical protein